MYKTFIYLMLMLRMTGEIEGFVKGSIRYSRDETWLLFKILSPNLEIVENHSTSSH